MNTDPLAALRPLRLPEPVGWWPPAPGWWLLAALGSILCALAVRALWRRWRSGRYRRAALRALAEARRAARSEPGTFAAAAAQILRRAALMRYGHERVAALSGREWLEFLDRSGRLQGFTGEPGQALARAPYDPSAPCDAEALAILCQRWLRRHR